MNNNKSPGFSGLFVCNEFKQFYKRTAKLITVIFIFPKINKFMKNSKYTKFVVITMVVLFVIVSMLSCTIHQSNSSNSSNKLPPGQAKKMSGSKSAKAYAPGQQKK